MANMQKASTSKLVRIPIEPTASEQAQRSDILYDQTSCSHLLAEADVLLTAMTARQPPL